MQFLSRSTKYFTLLTFLTVASIFLILLQNGSWPQNLKMVFTGQEDARGLSESSTNHSNAGTTLRTTSVVRLGKPATAGSYASQPIKPTQDDLLHLSPMEKDAQHHINDVKEARQDTQTHQEVMKNSKDKDTVIKARFSERQNLLRRVCNYSRYAGTTRPMKKKHDNVAFERLIYCGIAKVGTTFTSQTLPDLLEKHFSASPPTPFAENRRKSYFIVREPYSRLMSGYMGKIVTNQPWWVSHGILIVQTFRGNATAKMKKCGSDVTFSEFIKYVIKAQRDTWHKNEHWLPMFEQCSICIYDYDYIVHLETMQDDMQYILNSVNITVDLHFSDEEMTVRDKCKTITNQRSKILQCENMCSMLAKVWWTFQARGLIAENISLPVQGDLCNTITGDEFAELSWNAHLQSVGYINKRQQKRNALIKLFLSVPLKDRLMIRDLYHKDFDLFGYDPQPADLFPELVNPSEEA